MLEVFLFSVCFALNWLYNWLLPKLSSAYLLQDMVVYVNSKINLQGFKEEMVGHDRLTEISFIQTSMDSVIISFFP